ncbi:MAG: HNH endonuclease [Leptospiraceae bacterium]|nr:HNH endonuclease [Leptospiraceae bacterium]
MKVNKVKISEDFKLFISKIKNKRARIVIDHILKNGFITTEDLEKEYGYSHPPRAARDVRETGIPLETFSVKSSSGKSIAAYKFGDLNKVQTEKIGGRVLFSKKLKKELYINSKGKCNICNAFFEERYLQIDHRVPYEIVGDTKSEMNSSELMLVCASCNRAKSWSCEKCTNWLKSKKESTCKACYWGSPESYTHIATEEIRRLDLVWKGKETLDFDKVKTLKPKDVLIHDFIKEIIVKSSDKK